MQWLTSIGATSRTGEAGNRSRRAFLEQLESRVVLTGDPTVFDVYLDTGLQFGLPAEGSNESLTDTIAEWQLDLDIQDDEGGTFDIEFDLNNNGLFGAAEVGEPIRTVTLGPGEFQTLIWTIDWDVMADDLNMGDTHPNFVDYQTAVRVFESDVLVGLDNTLVSVFNSVPIFGEVSVLQDGGGGGGCGGDAGPVTVSGSFTEYGVNDTVTIRVNWGDGTIEDPNIEEFPFGVVNNETVLFSLEHDYASPGFYDITYEISDDENGFTSPNTGSELGFEVTGGGGGELTVCLDDNGVLTVNGSTGGDTVTVTASNGNLQVNSNFPDSPHTFAAALVNQIVVLLGDGNDTVSNGTTKAMVAVGGSGGDILMDSGGRAILIGGDGTDVLSGGGGQDILIDSSTDYDADTAALLALLIEWNAGTPLATRINNIMNGISVPALNGSTIDDDGVFDLLIGGGGIDWILLHSGDFSLGFGDVLTTL